MRLRSIGTVAEHSVYCVNPYRAFEIGDYAVVVQPVHDPGQCCALRVTLERFNDKWRGNGINLILLIGVYEREKRRLAKRLAELDKLFSALYEDKVMERVSERNYAVMREKYEREQLEADNRLRDIEAELSAKGM